MGRGIVKCVGSSFQLKSTHGGGLTLTVTCEKDEEQRLIKMVNHNVKNTSIISQKNGGNIIFRLPYGVYLEDLIPLMKDLEDNFSSQDKKGYIKDYSLSQPSKIFI
jgi:hypothetical protein